LQRNTVVGNINLRYLRDLNMLYINASKRI